MKHRWRATIEFEGWPLEGEDLEERIRRIFHTSHVGFAIESVELETLNQSPDFVITYSAKTKAHTNLRENRWRMKEIKDREKIALSLAWISAGKPRPTLPCEVRFIRIAPRPLDDGDGLTSAFKYIRDELCRCWGLTIRRGKQLQARDGADDGITWRYAQERGEPRYCGVRIEVRRK